MPYREPGRVATEEELAAARSENRCACRLVCMCYWWPIWKRLHGVPGVVDYEKIRGRR